MSVVKSEIVTDRGGGLTTLNECDNTFKSTLVSIISVKVSQIISDVV